MRQSPAASGPGAGEGDAVMIHAMPQGHLPAEALATPSRLAQRTVCDDGAGTRYEFEVHDLDARPDRLNAVYALANHEGLLFVGAAPDLRMALETEAPIRAARRAGACFLLVHAPAVTDFVPYAAAADRLIARFDPPLNR